MMMQAFDLLSLHLRPDSASARPACCLDRTIALPPPTPMHVNDGAIDFDAIQHVIATTEIRARPKSAS